MRLPRFSIAGIMALVALMALDCMAFRIISGTSNLRIGLSFFGGMPWLNVLLIGSLILRGRRRREEPRAFLVGFVAAGWAALLAYEALIFAFPSQCEAIFIRVTNPLDPLVDRIPPVGLLAAFGIAFTVTALPPWIVALAGGVLHRRYRLGIGRRKPEAVAP